jgi:hypothetical protein
MNEITNLKKESEDMHQAFSNSIRDHSEAGTSRQKSTSERAKKVFSKRKGPSPDVSVEGNLIDFDVDLIESPLPKSKKLEKSTKVPQDLGDANATINLSSDTEDDFMSPLNFRVRSNVAGLAPITPPTRYGKKGNSSMMNRAYLSHK